MEPPELDALAVSALDVHAQARAFATRRQFNDGDGKRSWYVSRWQLSHAGLEAMLADVEPVRWRRCVVRELIAWIISQGSSKDPPAVVLPEGLDTQEAIDDAWEDLGVRPLW